MRCSLYDGIRLEDDVFVGPDVSFTNDSRFRSGFRLETYPKTIVRAGASLGTGSVLLPGVTIGRWAMVGAASLVTRDVPDHALVYGSPAPRHGFVCRCGNTIPFLEGTAVCLCGRKYSLDPGEIVREESA